MKKILFLIIATVLVSCKSRLEDIHLDTNPYDEEYKGYNVVDMQDAKTIHLSVTSRPTRISLRVLTELYQSVTLYRDNVAFTTITRTAHGSDGLYEYFYDHTATVGSTHVYSAALHLDAGTTQRSLPLTFTKP
ncbi:MAG: hypothetical protein K0Q95_2391 [Bacteroidota bacterium]|jgi:hypothetical protein|nr:hypothetical protein [Bacteroidota bacterium]